MPLGLPKVAFLMPGDEEMSWVEVLLYRSRFLILGTAIDEESGNQLVGLLVFLYMDAPNIDMVLAINSPGGSIVHGLAVFDMMEWVEPDVMTVNVGFAASMASLILAGGEAQKRSALPHSLTLMHQPFTSSFKGHSFELRLEAEIMMALRASVGRAYEKRTGQALGLIHKDLERDSLMTATETKAYGIVDDLGRPDLFRVPHLKRKNRRGEDIRPEDRGDEDRRGEDRRGEDRRPEEEEIWSNGKDSWGEDEYPWSPE
nr:ATP-dependent Clp protease proteolytic subunit 1 [Aloysia citrodora]UVF36524.1 ATP-dependent Clp protease proteolytic subunit 1 [Aloysia citrodora]